MLQAPYPLPKTCDWQLLREEPLIVLAPASMAHRDPHDLLANEPLIRYDRNQWGGRQADEYLRKVGIVPRERFELNALNAIAVMVDRGLGVSLVPDWARPWPEGPEAGAPAAAAGVGAAPHRRHLVAGERAAAAGDGAAAGKRRRVGAEDRRAFTR